MAAEEEEVVVVVVVVVEQEEEADGKAADEQDTAGENELGLLNAPDGPDEVGVSGPEAKAALSVAANDASTNTDVPEGVVGGEEEHADADANADTGALDTAAGLDGVLDEPDGSVLAAGWKERIQPRGLAELEADPAGDPATPRLFHGREETCNETGRSTPNLLLRAGSGSCG